jgi:hypothetical protein
MATGGWVLRLVQAERMAERRLAAPTKAWPSLAGAGGGEAGGGEAGGGAGGGEPGGLARSAPGPTRGSPSAEPDPAPVPPPPPAEAWVPPTAGACPSSHPIKAKLRSRVFRLPESPGYDRVAADRCYCSAEDAEADGFHRARS